MKRLLLLLACLSFIPTLAAQEHPAISCSKQFSDHMVLQRGVAVPVWGWSHPDAQVSVAFAGQTKTATTDAKGRWQVVLDPLPASSENRDMTLTSGNDQLVFKNVLVGEVWLASGQSNMEWALRKFKDQGRLLPEVDRSLIRMITVKQSVSGTPQDKLEGEWVPLDSPSWLDCSATASYFAANLLKELKVPIGIIQSSWGGALIEPWMPREAFDRLEGGKEGISLDLTQEQLDALAKKPWDMKTPVAMYNTMIHPCVGFAMRGTIWYQGESNVGDAWYEQKMAALITSWRAAWGISDFPFYLVQLAPHRRYGGEKLGRMWEAQLNTARKMPHCGMAVIADSNQLKNIHPDNKPEVGRRLALWALAKDYGKPVVHSGPWFKGFKTEGRRIIVEFDHAESGLACAGDKIMAVRIQGEGDAEFIEATPVIEGGRLIVEHPQGKKALHVRMGWTREDVINLTNKEGLPASPFRTDQEE
jgi:sialate O-acetylesterase